MLNIFGWINLGIGIYMCFMMIINQTSNVFSKITLKAIPFFCGLANIFIGLCLLEVIKLGF